MKLTITEYKTVLSTITECRVIILTINEFDTGNTLKGIVTGKGSLLVGIGAGALGDLPAGVNGAIPMYDDTTVTGMKTVVLTSNEATMTNRSGVDMEAGTVCILHSTANSITTTTIVSDRRIFCITAEAIADLSSGRVLFYGVATVKVTGAVAVGQWLVASASAGRAKAVGYTKPIGAIGEATTANVSGDGTVTVILAIDWYLSLSAGKGYLQGNYAASTLHQILSFITETTAGATALPANKTEAMGLSSPDTAFLIANASAKTPYATDTPAVSTGTNLVTANTLEGLTGIQDTTKGIVAGGQAGGYAEKVIFSTESISLLPGADLSSGRQRSAGITNVTDGYFGGGNTGSYLATTDKTSLATETTAAMVSANLTTARTGAASISKSGSHGYFCGGDTGTKSVIVDKTVFATDSTSVSSSLNTGRAAASGLSAANGGFVGGGANNMASATGILTSVEKVDFATDTFSAVAGAALPTAQTCACAVSTLN